jgi:dTDP-4-dehydrorhamnose 3,5-epimerase
MHYPTVREIGSNGAVVPSGVVFRELKTITDNRGDLTELYRNPWAPGDVPVQWNLTYSRANVLRGVHVHKRHVDFLTIIAGEMLVGLEDVRPERTGSPSLMVRMSAADPHLVIIPPGVAHAFYFETAGTHIVGVTTEWDGHDEYGCHWQDPELQMDWPFSDPHLSLRDSQAGSRSEMIAAVGF